MNTPVLSVLVPVFQHHGQLEALVATWARVANVLAPQAIELRFADDAPRGAKRRLDEGLSGMEVQGMRVCWHALEKNYGQAAATWFLLAKAQGRFVLTQDEDMVLLPELVSRALAKLQDPEVDFVYVQTDAMRSARRQSLMAFALARLAKGKHKPPLPGSSCRVFRRRLVQHAQAGSKQVGRKQAAVLLDAMLYRHFQRSAYAYLEPQAGLRRMERKSGYGPWRKYRHMVHTALLHSHLGTALSVLMPFGITAIALFPLHACARGFLALILGLACMAFADALYAGHAPYRVRESWSKCG